MHPTSMPSYHIYILLLLFDVMAIVKPVSHLLLGQFELEISLLDVSVYSVFLM